MLMDGCPDGWDIAKEWMTRAGVRLNKQDEVYEWFRGPAWWADMAMEVSRMAHVFHMLAGKNSDVPLQADDILFVPTSLKKDIALKTLETLGSVGVSSVIYRVP